MRPHFGVFGPKSGLLYVTTELDHSVSIVDTKARKVIGAIPTGQSESHNVIISHDERRGYTSNVYAGTVSVLDIQGRKLITQIPVEPPDPAAKKQWQVQRISISPDDTMVFTADWPKSDIVVIDTASNTIKARVPLPSPGYGSASTPDGRYLLMVAEAANKVTVVDEHTLPSSRILMFLPGRRKLSSGPTARKHMSPATRTKKSRASASPIGPSDKSFDTGYYPDGLGWAPASH